MKAKQAELKKKVEEGFVQMKKLKDFKTCVLSLYDEVMFSMESNKDWKWGQHQEQQILKQMKLDFDSEKCPTLFWSSWALCAGGDELKKWALDMKKGARYDDLLAEFLHVGALEQRLQQLEQHLTMVRNMTQARTQATKPGKRAQCKKTD